MHFVSQESVAKVVTLDLARDAVRQALVAAADGSGSLYPVVMGYGANEGEWFAIKSGGAPARGALGLKLGSYWPGNDAHGIPRHSSTIVLVDVKTGRVGAIVEAHKLNGYRTAAADAVAADALARPDASTLAVIGAGHQAWYEVHALRAVRPIERVLVASRTEASAKSMVEELAKEGVAAQALSIEAACRAADIVVTATPSRAPLFEASWIRAGTHVASMGSDQKGKQELPPELLRRAKLFADVPQQSVQIGELQHVADDVAAGRCAITAIGAVLAGKAAGRTSRDDVTVFDSSGIALQDLFVAQAILAAATERGLAVRLA